MRLEDVAQVEELIGIIAQEVDLILLPLQDVLLLGELLILLADDAHGPADVVLIVVALLAGQLVDERLLDDLAWLELLAVEDLAGLGNDGEVLEEDGVATDIGEGDAIVGVEVEDLLEEVLDIGSAVDGHLLLGLGDCLGVAVVVC